MPEHQPSFLYHPPGLLKAVRIFFLHFGKAAFRRHKRLHYTTPEPIGQDSNYGNDKKCFHKISSFVLEKDIKQLKIPERSIKPKPIKNGAAQTHKNTSFIFFNFKD